MNIDNLTIAEVNFVKNLLSGLTDEQIIADQSSKTASDNIDNAYDTMITMGYTWGWTQGRSKRRALFLNNRTNPTLQQELIDAFRNANTMQLYWSHGTMANTQYEFKVERNTQKSYVKVASQLVERGLIDGTTFYTIARGEGIAEALIAIRNR